MVDDIVCNVCGGSEFYQDAGYSYCMECQTQTQEVKQLESLQQYDNIGVIRTRVRKVQKAKKPKEVNVNKLTSWECYNYILIGLVDELIKLGAKEELKDVIHMLWFKYLVKYEVIRAERDALPKLGAANWKEDAEILYGRPAKKPKLARKSQTATSTRALKNKLKRNAIMESYSQQNAMEVDDSFTHEQTLTSLRQDSVNESLIEVEYNTSVCEEVYKRSSIGKLDTETMKSLHLNTNNFSKKFLFGADVLSRITIYSLLYLGLLIINDKIQLGDMIRFTREGHLSFYKVEHFLPENSNKKNSSIQNWSKSCKSLKHFQMRQWTFEMGKALDVLQYISCQNLNELCERYCTELNLPDEIWRYTVNLLSRMAIKMDMNKESFLIPNYEGRVMATIIFVLKLFLCLDGETEDEFSRCAKLLNKRIKKDTKMFVWSDWIHYINYRKIVLIQHHFPTQLYENENVHNVDIYTNYFKSYMAQRPTECNLTATFVNIKNILELLKEKQGENNDELKVNGTLTPFRDYINVLRSTDIPKVNNYINKILKRNFKSHSLEFLTKPLDFLNRINGSEIQIKKRGKNVNLKLTELPTGLTKKEEETWQSAAERLLPIKVVKTHTDTTSQEYVIHNYKLEPTEQKCNLTPYVHYKSYKNYWIKTAMSPIFKTKLAANKFIDGFPEPFKFVLNECARITEQDTRCIAKEFTVAEIYISTAAIFSGERHMDVDPPFNVVMKYAREKW